MFQPLVAGDTISARSRQTLGVRASGCCSLLVLTAIAGASPALAIDEFHAYLLPETTLVEVGQTITLTFAVDSTAAQFNAYQATFQWDPLTLDFQSATLGSLLTVPGCGAPWFAEIGQTDSTVSISASVMCNGVSLDGPGDLCQLTFAATVPGSSVASIASDPDRTFLDAGLWVWPGHQSYPRQVIFHDAFVSVYDPTLAVPDGPDRGEIRTRFHPNPSRAGGLIELEPGRGAATALIGIYDAEGRRVWWQEITGAGSGTRRVAWAGRDRAGRRLPGGVYHYRVAVSGQRRTGHGRIVIVP